jgi:mono/diheme cytochrome c family protein
VVSALALAAAIDSVHAADVERGAALYYEHGCYSCHGHHGLGTFAEVQTNLLPAPLPLISGTAPFLSSEDIFRVYMRLRSGEDSAAPQVGMPHYPETTLDDEAITDLYAYLLTLSDTPPPLDEIPVMRAILESAEQD